MKTPLLLAAATILAGGLAVDAAPARADPAIYVYKGPGCEGRGRLARYQGVIGHKLDGVNDFFAFDSWPSLIGSADGNLTCWQGQPYRMSLAVPLIVKGATLSGAAAGDYDAQFRKLGALLVAKGQARAVLRLGWEFNGGWYPWSAQKDPGSFAAAWRHVATVLRQTPGAHFQLAWNPSLGVGANSPQTLWPGDDVVDLIGLDFYNQSWRPQDKDPAMRWQGYLTGNYGLNWVSRFAQLHGKRIVLPEWGTGTRPDGHGFGDDPGFIHHVAAWMRANKVLYAGYWDFTASDYDATMSAGKYPATLAAYKAEFVDHGGGGGGH